MEHTFLLKADWNGGATATGVLRPDSCKQRFRFRLRWEALVWAPIRMKCCSVQLLPAI